MRFLKPSFLRSLAACCFDKSQNRTWQLLIKPYSTLCSFKRGAGLLSFNFRKLRNKTLTDFQQFKFRAAKVFNASIEKGIKTFTNLQDFRFLNQESEVLSAFLSGFKRRLKTLCCPFKEGFRDFGRLLFFQKTPHLFSKKTGKYPVSPKLSAWIFQSNNYFSGKNTQGKTKMSISLLFCYNHFCEYTGIAKNPKRFANFNSDLKHYLRAEGQSDQEIKKSFQVCLDSIPLSALKNAEEKLENYLKGQVESGQLKPRSAANIRSSFRQFREFIRQQEYFRQVNDRWHGKYMPSALQGESWYGQRRGKGKDPKSNPYSLGLEEFPKSCLNQIEEFRYFYGLREVPNRLSPPLRDVTINAHIFNVRCFFGFLINVLGGDLSRLGITLEDFRNPPKSLQLIKGDLVLQLMTEPVLLNLFIAWGLNERWQDKGQPPNGYSWALRMATTAKKTAEWEHRFAEDYEEVEVVRQLARIIKRLRKRAELEGEKPEEAPPSFINCAIAIEWLRDSCAHRWHSRKSGSKSTYKRTDLAIARSWLRYLICALLLYCAMRQREVRELELNKTLFKRGDSYWVVLAPPRHKHGSKTGRSREYPLPDFLTSDIDEWLTIWRPKIANMVAQKYPEKTHNPNLVFCALGSNSNPEVLGNPIKDCHLYSLVKYAMFRSTSAVFGTGIEIGPHRFRDIAVTHHRENGDPDQKEALAEMMGHSVATADKYYKKLQSRQITKKVKNWWNHYLAPIPKKNEKPGDQIS